MKKALDKALELGRECTGAQGSRYWDVVNRLSSKDKAVWDEFRLNHVPQAYRSTTYLVYPYLYDWLKKNNRRYKDE